MRTWLALFWAGLGCGGAPPAIEPVPATGAWMARADVGLGPRQETAVVAAAGRIWLIGGFIPGGTVVADNEAYDPQTDKWTTRAPLPRALHHCNAAVVNEQIYVAGCLRDLSFDAVGDVLRYDPAADRWHVETPLPAGTERGSSATAAIGPLIYVAGGLRGASVSDVSRYDTVKKTWEALPPLPEARDHLVGAAVADVFYAIGGRNSRLSQRVDAFRDGAWTARSPLPTARGGMAGAVLHGHIYVLGGEGNRGNAQGIFDEAESYDAATDLWLRHPAMRTPRHGTGAAALAGAIYIPGGATLEGFGAVATHEVYTPAPTRK